MNSEDKKILEDFASTYGNLGSPSGVDYSTEQRFKKLAVILENYDYLLNRVERLERTLLVVADALLKGGIVTINNEVLKEEESNATRNS